jgi:hypothetical protein
VSRLKLLAQAVLLALPGALTVYTAFNAGGYFAGTQGLLAAILAVLLLLRVTLAADPVGGAGRPLLVAAAALTLLGAWTLLSESWSDAPARALLEWDRTLVYLLVLLLFGTLPFTPQRLRWALRGVALACLAVCTVALITRTLPDVWEIGPNVANRRLSYPITYWNALGLLGVLGGILAVHVSASEREAAWVRVLGAAALPILAATVYLTFSRAAIAISLVGLLAYVLLARPRLLWGALAAALPTVAVAVAAAYRADLLATEDPTSAAATAQGHDVAVVVGLCVAGAALLRGLMLLLDRRVVGRAPRFRVPGVAQAGAVAGVLVLGGGIAVAAGAPGEVREQYDVFVNRPEPKDTGDLRDRLRDPSSNGRVDQWRVSDRGWREDRLKGQGAGTYQHQWNRHRPSEYQVVDAHSLYLELLSELGLVGLVLAATALVALLAGVATRIRGPERAVFAAVFAVLLTWALRAGVDWDWEMPVVTLPVLALAAAALAARPEEGDPAPARGAPVRPGRVLRIVLGLGCLLLAVMPLRIAVSQGRLNQSVRAFRAGDCPKAVDRALDSLSALGTRPEPREILGFCDVRLGRPDLGVRVLDAAVERDPRSWELHYSLALVRAAAGRDPRPELLRAARLNPREGMIIRARERFATPDSRVWRRRSRTAELPPI